MQCQNDILSAFDQEVSQYLLLTKNAAAFSEIYALAFWKQHNLRFLLLAKIASVYLAFSTSSVPVKSHFSTTGLILNSKRSSMIPSKFNLVSFIHEN